MMAPAVAVSCCSRWGGQSRVATGGPKSAPKGLPAYISISRYAKSPFVERRRACSALPAVLRP